MSDNPSVEDILNPPTVEAPEPAPQEQPAAEPVVETGQPRDELGKFAPKQQAAPAPEPTGEKPPPVAPPAAAPPQLQSNVVPASVLAEQRREARFYRQQAEEYQRQLQELQKPKAEPVDFYSDPDAALNQRLEPFQQQFEQRLSTLTMRASRAEAVFNHGKDTVAAMEVAVNEAMEAGDPEVMQLRQQLLSSDDPVGVAVNWYQRKRVLSEVGTDPAAYREKLKAEIRAEMQGQQPAAPQPAAVMPSNLAGARNVGTRAGPAWSGPPKLDDILAHKSIFK